MTEEQEGIPSTSNESAVPENTTKSAEESPRVKLDPLPPDPHVEMKSPTSSPLTEKGKKKFEEWERLALVSTPPDEFNKIIEEVPNLDITSSEAGQRWYALLQTAQEYLMRGNALIGALSRNDGLWRQSVANGGEELRAGKPRFGENSDPNNHLTGERAVLKMTSVLGLGAIVQIPLWHTGIWLSLKVPSEAELLELERRLSMEKVALGRATNGLVYSNSSIYSNSYLINLALSKVYDASVKDINLQTLKETILLTDLQTLIWGLACTIWPNGYPYEEPCTADPANCQYVMSELLNITKLSWTDNRALTEFQRKHMAVRNNKATPDQLKRYKEEHKYNDKRTFSMKDGELTVELRVPTLAEYEQSGFDWVDNIVSQTDQAFGTSMTDEERNEYIINQGKATTMRQYSHWVERLVLADDGGIVNDRATIEQVITTLSSDGECQKEFFDGIAKFIDATTISLIALPRYECPNCHKDSKPESKVHPHLVPMDVARVFFTLLGQRSYKVRQRSVM